MLLKTLLDFIAYREIINRGGLCADNMEISDICKNSNDAHAGCVFVCIRGAVSDGHDYAKKAYDAGCRVFVAEELPHGVGDDSFVVLSADTRVSLAQLSACFFGEPAKQLTMIGITGTKGKTTTSLLIYNILRENGISAAYIGSNGINYGDKCLSTLNTTPESYELHKYMRDMVDAGVTTLVMEVSSQALKMARVHGIKYKVAVFTNLSPDHIGEFEHPDFEDYKRCKRELFTSHGAECIVYNADDEHAMSVVGGTRAKKIGLSLKSKSDISASGITYFRSVGNIGVSFECAMEGKTFPVALSFPGEFSVYNAMTAIAVCRELGLGVGVITKTMRHIRIKGRFETYELPSGATVVIDYAHNGVSLKVALSALRIYSPTRLVCLFGSIGGRTKMRRAELGLVASRDADFCIITSDDPGYEPPSAIISEIAAYFTAGTCPYIAIPDRRAAIEYALKNSKQGDILLFAGKGHETHQLICGVREEFSEAAIVEKYCNENKNI